jgi:hypothetical protein
MDLDNFTLPEKFYRWSVSLALSLIIMAFVLAAADPSSKRSQPCENVSSSPSISYVEAGLP